MFSKIVKRHFYSLQALDTYMLGDGTSLARFSLPPDIDRSLDTDVVAWEIHALLETLFDLFLGAACSKMSVVWAAVIHG